jgi:transcriptional regulator with XRE-family HTH domain
MSTTDWNHLPKWLPKKIKATGLTVEQVAQRTNISRTVMYKYLSDLKRPSEQTALRLSRVLGVTFEEILAQYTPKKNGRPRDSDTTRGVTVRSR